MDKGHIYLLTSPSKKQYIGQTVCYLSSGSKHGYIARWKEHVIESKNNYSRVLDNAIRKYEHNEFNHIMRMRSRD